MLFRIIFIVICLTVFLWAGYRVGNIDKKTRQTERIIWSLIIILFTAVNNIIIKDQIILSVCLVFLSIFPTLYPAHRNTVKQITIKIILNNILIL